MTAFSRKIILVATIIIVLFLSFTVYTFWLSSEAREGKANREKIKNVKVGMTKDELLLIMGSPKSVIAPVDWKSGAQKEGQIFIYQAPPLASDNLSFYLDTDSIVKSINYGD